MADVVLFHHAQGLTAGVVAFADELRRAGHTVHTPDLFAGRTFATVEEGVGHAQEIGFGEVIERGARAVDGLPAELVYAGFSLGVLPAQKLAQTRAGARGALLFHACIPVSEFSAGWPATVPVQVHAMDADPFFVGDGDIDAARALIAEARDAELFLYPGYQHLFADSSLASHDADAAALLRQRALGFLSARDSHAQRLRTKIELTLDCTNAPALAEFWKLAVGYVENPPPAPYTTQAEYLKAQGADGVHVVYLHDPDGAKPFLCLLEVPEPKTAKNRLHFDLVVSGEGSPEEQWQRVTSEVARLRAAGASLLAEFAGHHVVMADPEGNEFCVT